MHNGNNSKINCDSLHLLECIRAVWVANIQYKVMSTHPISAKVYRNDFFFFMYYLFFYKGYLQGVSLTALVFCCKIINIKESLQQKNFPEDNIYEFLKFSYFIRYSE